MFARTGQKVFATNVNDNKTHTFDDWVNGTLNVTNEQTRNNLMMSGVDITFTLLTGELFKWSRQIIMPCYQNSNIINSSIWSTLLIHVFSILSNLLVITCASMYTLKSFTWLNYAWKLINGYNFLSTISRLYAMIGINNIFKWSLSTLNNELQLSNIFNLFLSITSKLYVMTGINNIFKWSLSTLNNVLESFSVFSRISCFFC